MKDRTSHQNESRSEYGEIIRKSKRLKTKKKTNVPNEGICFGSFHQREKHFEELESYQEIKCKPDPQLNSSNSCAVSKAFTKGLNENLGSSDVLSSISEDIDVSEEIHDRCIHDSIISGLLTNDDTKEERVQTLNTMEEEIANEECNEEDVIDENVTCLL